MKILKSNLLAAIATPAKIAKVKATLPILSTIRIEATNGAFTATGNNLDEFAMSKTECEGELEPCCISERQLSSIIALLPDEIEMTLDKQLCFGENFKLSVMPAVEFPTWKTEGVKNMGIPCTDLADVIESVKFAASRDKNKEGRFGVRVICDHKKVSAESYSGTEFSRCSKALIAVPANFFIPLDFVPMLCNSLNQKESVFSLSENIARVEYQNGEYACKLGEGSTLSLDNVLNAKRTKIGEIHVDKWLPLFHAALEIAGMDSKISCQVAIDGNRFRYSGIGGEISPDMPEPLAIKENPIKVNAMTFIRCLSAFNGSPVSFEFMENDAIYMKSGDLIVCTTQMR